MNRAAMAMWLALATTLPTPGWAADPANVGQACARELEGQGAEAILACIQQRLASAQPASRPSVARQPAPSPAPSAPRAPSTQRAVLADAPATQGCPYQLETGYGLAHPPGAKMCVGKRSLRCDMAGKNTAGQFEYAWHTVAEKDCLSGYRDAAVVERNGTVARRALEKMKFEEE